MVNQRLIAFWEYNGLPGFLYGEVTEFYAPDRVRVQNYPGMNFTPFKIVPWSEELEESLESIKELKTAHREHLRTLEHNFLLSVNMKLPFNLLEHIGEK